VSHKALLSCRAETDFSVINPTTGDKLVAIPEGLPEDVDVAIKAAHKAFNTTWGLNCPGFQRGKYLIKIAELIERDLDIIASLEALDNGKTFSAAKGFDVTESAACFRYYGGWADKIHGKTIEVSSVTVVRSVWLWDGEQPAACVPDKRRNACSAIGYARLA